MFVRFHRIDSIVDEIKKNLHQLIAITAYARKHGFKLQLDPCFWRTIERTKLYRVGDDRIDVEKCALRRNLSRKAKKIADERFRPASLVANFTGARTSFVRKRWIIGEQI